MTGTVPASTASGSPSIPYEGFRISARSASVPATVRRVGGVARADEAFM